MGARTDWAEADPMTYAERASGLSFLVMHGTRDPVVHPRASESFHAAIRPHARDTRLEMVEDAYHADLMHAFLRSGREANLVAEWLRGLSAERDSAEQ
jgi:alpha-beta hydrolase superfamily lysophospholipase